MLSCKLRQKIGAGIQNKPPPKPALSVVERRQHKPFVAANIRLEENKHQPQRGTSRRCAKCSTMKRPMRTIWAKPSRFGITTEELIEEKLALLQQTLWKASLILFNN
ncbi:hypothetical protein LSTR_LSTR000080 [Laodelphax striatellus]|uniref:Uncharacterized protein n=1 Tax=Laodelphax striatellus TaxID=195883 RepID=A0A482X6V0_LAOST|nr:hypothetical protein LSTR_LSTR000080 [Laodelphax striatellus]